MGLTHGAWYEGEEPRPIHHETVAAQPPVAEEHRVKSRKCIVLCMTDDIDVPAAVDVEMLGSQTVAVQYLSVPHRLSHTVEVGNLQEMLFQQRTVQPNGDKGGRPPIIDTVRRHQRLAAGQQSVQIVELRLHLRCAIRDDGVRQRHIHHHHQRRVAHHAQVVDVHTADVDTPLPRVDDAVPQVLPVGRHLHQQQTDVVVGDTLERVYGVEPAAGAHLHQAVGVALAVSHQTPGKVHVIVAIAIVTLRPFKLLGVGGEGQQDERRQQDDSLGCFHIELLLIIVRRCPIVSTGGQCGACPMRWSMSIDRWPGGGR